MDLFSEWFFRVAAGWCVVASLILFLAAFDDTKLVHERVLRQTDVVFGFSNQSLMLAAGTFHLVLGVVLFLMRDLVSRVLLVGWGISVCAIYQLGFNWLGGSSLRPVDSCPAVRLAADKIGISPRHFGVLWGLVLGVMLVGGILQLFLAWRRRKRREEAAFMERWRETHPDKGRFPWAR